MLSFRNNIFYGHIDIKPSDNEYIFTGVGLSLVSGMNAPHAFTTICLLNILIHVDQLLSFFIFSS